MKLDISDVEKSKKAEKIDYKNMPEIKPNLKESNLNFSKKKFESKEDINEDQLPENENENSTPENENPTPENENSTPEMLPIIRTNRYYLDFKIDEIESEKKRLKNLMYGPSILVARNRKEYYQMMSFRRHRIFKLKTIKEIESKYIPEDRYFEAVKDFKKRLENLDEKNIRNFLKIFYFEE